MLVHGFTHPVKTGQPQIIQSAGEQSAVSSRASQIVGLAVRSAKSRYQSANSRNLTGSFTIGSFQTNGRLAAGQRVGLRHSIDRISAAFALDKSAWVMISALALPSGAVAAREAKRRR